MHWKIKLLEHIWSSFLRSCGVFLGRRIDNQCLSGDIGLGGDFDWMVRTMSQIVVIGSQDGPGSHRTIPQFTSVEDRSQNSRRIKWTDEAQWQRCRCDSIRPSRLRRARPKHTKMDGRADTELPLTPSPVVERLFSWIKGLLFPGKKVQELEHGFLWNECGVTAQLHHLLELCKVMKCDSNGSS